MIEIDWGIHGGQGNRVGQGRAGMCNGSISDKQEVRLTDESLLGMSSDGRMDMVKLNYYIVHT